MNDVDVGYNQFTRFYTNKLSEEHINGMIRHIDSIPAIWQSGKTDGGDVNPARNCNVKWIKDNKVKKFIWNEFIRANNDEDFRFDIINLEDIQYTSYGVGQHYNWHNDTIRANDDGVPSIRKLSMTIVLNDEFEGGEFEIGENQGFIDNLGKYNLQLRTHKFNLKKGDMVVFPSNLDHRVNIVTQGQRNVLVAWAWGPLFK